MINHLKPINSNFALGPKMRKKYSQNAIVMGNVGKTSTLMRKSEN
jgi:hypothetical protein